MWAIAALVLLGIAAWAYFAAYAEASKLLPPELHENRFAIDAFIWSHIAPAPLRRRYVLAQGAGVASCGCLAAFTWPKNIYAGMAFAAVMLGGSAMLLWQIRRHGLS